MTSRVLNFGLILLVFLSLAACGRGARDSLLLTGLRGKPDESKVSLQDELVLPPDDRVVVPNTTTAVAVKRNDTYKVHKILFGEELAQQEIDRQLLIQQQNALSATEQELLRSVRARNGNRQVEANQSRSNGLFNLRLPRWFRR